MQVTPISALVPLTQPTAMLGTRVSVPEKEGETRITRRNRTPPPPGGLSVLRSVLEAFMQHSLATTGSITSAESRMPATSAPTAPDHAILLQRTHTKRWPGP